MSNGPLTLVVCLLGSLFLFGATASPAQELRLNAHGPSSHFGSESASDNAWTFGGGGEVRWESGNWQYGALAGGYHNSVWKLTVYAGVSGSYQITEWLAMGLGVSAATGYDGDVCYQMENGNTSCYQLEWAKPVTILPLPFIALGRDVEFRIGGFSNLESGLMHVMVSVPLQNSSLNL